MKPMRVTTLGGVWAKLFENSLARKLAGIEHFDLGNSNFKISKEQVTQILDAKGFDMRKDDSILQARLNSPTHQASELVFKYEWFVKNSSLVFIDSVLLDTAIGHHILLKSPLTYAISTDMTNSPLAPAFLKGILYPKDADDLVKVVLNELVTEVKSSDQTVSGVKTGCMDKADK